MTESRTLTIDPSVAPFLIGSRGSTVKRMEERSGTRIKVSADEGTVCIVGPAHGVATAATLIEQHLATDRYASTLASGPPAMTMPFDADLREVVFGPRGSTVRKIEQDTGAIVRVDKERCTISAWGTAAAATRVEQLYKQLLAQGFGDETSVTLRVADGMSRLIVGERGSTVKEMERATGARITVARHGGNTVELRGSRDAVRAAQERIEALVGIEAAAVNGRNTTGAGGDGFTMQVPEAAIALIIGTRGATVKGLEQQTGARINVGRDGTISIRGAEASIAAAHAHIERIAASDAGQKPSGRGQQRGY